MRIDKNTTNDNMEPNTVIEQKTSIREEMTKARTDFRQTDVDTLNPCDY